MEPNISMKMYIIYTLSVIYLARKISLKVYNRPLKLLGDKREALLGFQGTGDSLNFLVRLGAREH